MFKISGSGPTTAEVDRDLAHLEREINVYQLNEYEWWAGKSLQECIDAATVEWKVDESEQHVVFDKAHQLSLLELNELRYFDPDTNTFRTFRDELERRIADAAQTFPQFFATTEY